VDGEGKYKTQVKHNKNTTANDKQTKEGESDLEKVKGK
jgi:hypothetical protein